LRFAERRTLLVDIDPQCSATKGLGVKAGPAGDMYSVLSEKPLSTSIIIPTELDYLSVAPASRDLVGVELDLVAAVGREFRLKGAAAGIRDRYDHILIDCPPSLGLITVNALAAADGILVPVQCEYLALEGVSQMVETLQRVQASINPDLVVDGVLLTMFERQDQISPARWSTTFANFSRRGCSPPSSHATSGWGGAELRPPDPPLRHQIEGRRGLHEPGARGDRTS